MKIIINTDDVTKVASVVDRVDRLNELVEVVSESALLTIDQKLSEKVDWGVTLTVTAGSEAGATSKKIEATLNWFDEEPPCLLPVVDFSEERLLSLIFFKLKNYEQAFSYLEKEEELTGYYLVVMSLIEEDNLDPNLFEVARAIPHNLMMVHCHYGTAYSEDGEILEELEDNEEAFLNHFKQLYKKTIADESAEYCCFTAKYYIDFLIDYGRHEQARKVSESVNEMLEDIEAVEKSKEYKNQLVSSTAKNAMAIQRANLMFMEQELPYDKGKLKVILEVYLAGIRFYEERGLKVQAGLVLLEATEVAICLEDFKTGKNVVGKAMVYFKSSDINHLLGEASFKKGKLFHLWSKKDTPEHYKVAVNAFQDALKVFTPEEYPYQNSEVNHLMGLLYSEMKGSEVERNLWCSFSAAAFKQALEACPPEMSPYQHAMICHNYATALMGFPEGKLNNHLDKARELFETALQIRTADSYPTERALTLLNRLELHWLEHNEDTSSQEIRYKTIMSLVDEVKSLVDDVELIAQAEAHLVELKKISL